MAEKDTILQSKLKSRATKLQTIKEKETADDDCDELDRFLKIKKLSPLPQFTNGLKKSLHARKLEPAKSSLSTLAVPESTDPILFAPSFRPGNNPNAIKPRERIYVRKFKPEPKSSESTTRSEILNASPMPNSTCEPEHITLSFLDSSSSPSSAHPLISPLYYPLSSRSISSHTSPSLSPSLGSLSPSKSPSPYSGSSPYSGPSLQSSPSPHPSPPHYPGLSPHSKDRRSTVRITGSPLTSFQLTPSVEAESISKDADHNSISPSLLTSGSSGYRDHDSIESAISDPLSGHSLHFLSLNRRRALREKATYQAPKDSTIKSDIPTELHDRVVSKLHD